MTALKVLLVVVWGVVQLLGLLIGGWALLGFQNGQVGTGLLGLLLLFGPPVIALGALWHAARDPAQATPVLLGAVLLLIVGAGTLLMLVGRAGGG